MVVSNFLVLAVLLILLVISAFFSGMETALFSLTDIHVRSLVEQRVWGSKYLLKLKKNSERLLITILIGNDVVNIVAAGLATVFFTRLFGSSGVGIATGVMTLLVLVFGDILPKTFFHAHAEKMALSFGRIFYGLVIIFTPIVYILEKFARLVIYKSGQTKEQLSISESELRIMAHVGVDAGTINKAEEELIEKAFRFNDIQVAEVMTPRTNMVTLKSTTTINEALKVITKSGYTRIPIFEGNRDNIIGVLFLKDILTYLQKGRREVSISELKRTPFLVPKQTFIDELFREMQKTRTHLAIVVGEYGETVGIVTFSDLLGQLVGEIKNEYYHKTVKIKRVNRNTVDIDTSVSVTEINQILGLHLPAGEFRTISGLMLEIFQHIPKKGEKAKLENVSFVVLEANRQRIKSVRVIKGN